MINSKKLKKMMDKQGVNNTELAAAAKVSDAMMSYIISGDKVPGLAVVGRIARRLGCTVEELIIY